MRALADSGRRTDALREFQVYRTVLRDEVGTDPSDAIVRLDREIARAHDETAAGESSRVFLMTDIVGSTRSWAEEPEAMAADLARHDADLARAIDEYHGEVISRAGDSFVAAFADASDAVAAAVDAQQALSRDRVDARGRAAGPDGRARGPGPTARRGLVRTLAQ